MSKHLDKRQLMNLMLGIAHFDSTPGLEETKLYFCSVFEQQVGASSISWQDMSPESLQTLQIIDVRRGHDGIFEIT